MATSEADNPDFPWPDDPQAVREHARVVARVARGAAAELGEVPSHGCTYWRPDLSVLAKAQAVAFDSMGFTYEWVPLDEYRRRIVASGPKPVLVEGEYLEDGLLCRIQWWDE